MPTTADLVRCERRLSKLIRGEHIAQAFICLAGGFLTYLSIMDFLHGRFFMSALLTGLAFWQSTRFCKSCDLCRRMRESRRALIGLRHEIEAMQNER